MFGFQKVLHWFHIDLYWGSEPWIWELAQANPSKIQKVKTSMTFDQAIYRNIGCFNFFWWQKVKTSSSLLIKILIEILDVLTFLGATKIGTRSNVLIKISYVILKCFNFFWWRLSGLSKGIVRISKGIVRISKGIVGNWQGIVRISKELAGFQKQ